jgi:hypothetical protein
MRRASSELNDWGRPEYKRSDLGKVVRGKYAKLSKSAQETVELEYHRLKPESFDQAMSRARPHTPAAVSTSKRNTEAEKKDSE